MIVCSLECFIVCNSDVHEFSDKEHALLIYLLKEKKGSTLWSQEFLTLYWDSFCFAELCMDPYSQRGMLVRFLKTKNWSIDYPAPLQQR